MENEINEVMKHYNNKLNRLISIRDYYYYLIRTLRVNHKIKKNTQKSCMFF
jgi:hypothetical protein